MINNTEIFLNVNTSKNEISFFVYEFLKKKTIYTNNFNFSIGYENENEDNLRNTILEIEKKFSLTVNKIKATKY